MIKQRIAAAALAATLFGSVAVGTVSAQSNAGGAAGLIAAVVQLAVDDGVVTVNVVDSFNNLRALNNVLNNNDVDITVGDVSLLSNFLNANNIALEDLLNDNQVVVAVGLLSTGDFIIFV
ncbi:MAG: hypothetical protein H0V24_04730 [Chloroflexia bacterium]|nr:hypothetical protein [Chloroflexia bacterium]